MGTGLSSWLLDHAVSFPSVLPLFALLAVRALQGTELTLWEQQLFAAGRSLLPGRAALLCPPTPAPSAKQLLFLSVILGGWWHLVCVPKSSSYPGLDVALGSLNDHLGFLYDGFILSFAGTPYLLSLIALWDRTWFSREQDQWLKPVLPALFMAKMPQKSACSSRLFNHWSFS